MFVTFHWIPLVHPCLLHWGAQHSRHLTHAESMGRYQQCTSQPPRTAWALLYCPFCRYGGKLKPPQGPGPGKVRHFPAVWRRLHLLLAGRQSVQTPTNAMPTLVEHKPRCPALAPLKSLQRHCSPPALQPTPPPPGDPKEITALQADSSESQLTLSEWKPEAAKWVLYWISWKQTSQKGYFSAPDP